MKATVTINSRDIITLPATLRLEADDQLIAEITPEGLLLRPAVTLPIEICTSEREREFDNRCRVGILKPLEIGSPGRIPNAQIHRVLFGKIQSEKKIAPKLPPTLGRLLVVRRRPGTPTA